MPVNFCLNWMSANFVDTDFSEHWCTGFPNWLAIDSCQKGAILANCRSWDKAVGKISFQPLFTSVDILRAAFCPVFSKCRSLFPAHLLFPSHSRVQDAFKTEIYWRTESTKAEIRFLEFHSPECHYWNSALALELSLCSRIWYEQRGFPYN